MCFEDNTELNEFCRFCVWMRLCNSRIEYSLLLTLATCFRVIMIERLIKFRINLTSSCCVWTADIRRLSRHIWGSRRQYCKGLALAASSHHRYTNMWPGLGEHIRCARAMSSHYLWNLLLILFTSIKRDVRSDHVDSRNDLQAASFMSTSIKTVTRLRIRRMSISWMTYLHYITKHLPILLDGVFRESFRTIFFLKIFG